MNYYINKHVWHECQADESQIGQSNEWVISNVMGKSIVVTLEDRMNSK